MVPLSELRCRHTVKVKQSRTTGPCPPPSPPTMSSASLLPVENFSQKISLIREVRNAETKENRLRKLSNNNVVIK